ncbi:MAG TPA: S8 family serine peptidase [Bacillaceae bacterium]
MRKKIRSFLSVLLLAALLCGGLPSGKALGTNLNGAKVDPALEKALSALTGSLQVIVTFKGDGAPTEQNLDLLSRLGINKGVTMKSLPIAGVVATKTQIERLAASDQIQSVYLNQKLKYYNADATMITGVDKIRTDQEMTKANGGIPFSGKGIGVVVNDSGVDGTHKDHEFGRNLVQNVMGTTNLNSLDGTLLPVTYLENIPNTDTTSGHGTHVAGTVGGTGAMSGGKYEGAASGADLIGYGSGAALFNLDSIGGFDYAITHQREYNIRIITNSWGSSGDFDPYHPVNIASKKAYDRGITVLFAAGNEGPGEDTHNPYAKAPWVISIAAGEKNGKLADFSSRGTKGVGGTFEMDGKSWTWEDRPTITAPGVDIISTRVLAPVSTLGADKDAELIEPAYLPFYTVMSGTSMATPHAAGIVALMLEANPLLSPDEVKQILQDTATNMPGYESWEAGAGYVNAYAAIDHILNGKKFGSTLNMTRTFNSSVETSEHRSSFTVNYNPVTALSSNQYEFEVPAGTAGIVAKVNGTGLLGETGNPINLVLISPDGEEFSSGISLLFALYTDRTVSVSSPKAGAWKAEIRGLKGVAENPLGAALPEEVHGTIALFNVSGFSGLKDIAGHAAENAIKLAVKERLVDARQGGYFKPDSFLTREELAQYLVMGAEIRQSLGSKPMFTDVNEKMRPFAEAATAKGAAFRDSAHIQNGVILPKAQGKFAPNDAVNRAELAYSLVQSLGLEERAKSHKGEVTVQYNDRRIVLDDQNKIPDHLKGYVQTALNLNMLNAHFSIYQGPFDLLPTVHAKFNPDTKVTRGEYATAITRFFNAYQ